MKFLKLFFFICFIVISQNSDAQSKKEQIEILNFKISLIEKKIDSLSQKNSVLKKEFQEIINNIKSVNKLKEYKVDSIRRISSDLKSKLKKTKDSLNSIPNFEIDNILTSYNVSERQESYPRRRYGDYRIINFDSITKKVYSWFQYKGYVPDIGVTFPIKDDGYITRHDWEGPIIYMEFNEEGEADGRYMLNGLWYEVKKTIPIGENFVYPLKLLNCKSIDCLDFYDFGVYEHTFLKGTNNSELNLDGEFLLIGRFHNFQLKFSNGVLNNIIGSRSSLDMKDKKRDSNKFQITFNDIGELSGVKTYYNKILQDSISFKSPKSGYVIIDKKYLKYDLTGGLMKWSDGEKSWNDEDDVFGFSKRLQRPLKIDFQNARAIARLADIYVQGTKGLFNELDDLERNVPLK